MAANEKVDVLIIGSGASGAAVAWSLADTKMRILCLEQGDWMKPTDYPEQRPRLGGAPASAISPSARTAAARDTDYPINDDNSPIKVVNFNGVGGSTIMYTAHLPRLHPSRLPGEDARRRRRRLADRLRDAGAVLRRERPHDGRLRPGRRSRLSAARSRRCRRSPLGKSGAALSAKAMNKLGWHWWPSDTTIATTDYEGRGALHQPRPLHAGLRAGRQGQHRHHLLAAGDPRRRRAAHALPGARDHHRRARHGDRRRSTTTPTASSSSSRPRSSSWPATASARRACC